MKDEFTVIFNTTPHVLSEEYIEYMDLGIIWEETTQESWYDWCAAYSMMSV